jgi:diguanylate cyclase
MKFLTKQRIWVLSAVLTAAAGLWASSLFWSRSGLPSLLDASALRAWLAIESAKVNAGVRAFGFLQEAFPLAWGLGLVSFGALVGFVSAPRVNEAAQRVDAQGAKQSAAEIAAARQRLDNELGAILNLVQSHLDRNKSYSAALARGCKELASHEGPEQVRAAIVLLINENQQMIRELEKYKRGLEEKRAQISALRSALVETRELSARDSLTGVYTRRRFDSALAKEVSEAKRNFAALSLIMADIDDFKKFNDTYGHLIGDEILKGVAKIISTNVKRRDTVARFGGEEFAILLPETSVDGAVSVAEEIRGRLHNTKWTLRGGPQIEVVTASFGVAELAAVDSAEDLLQRADAKLYEAKFSGRNRVVSSSDAAAAAAAEAC